MSWKYFHANPPSELHPLQEPPECPPWRQFRSPEDLDKKKDKEDWEALRSLAKADQRSQQRGQSFRLPQTEDGTLTEEGESVVDAVNAAIHLRRPLLITGVPGSGKTSLAYAIAHELQLGPVLTWPITARSNLVDAEYRYDAIARLQDAQLQKIQGSDPKPTTPGQQPDQEVEAANLQVPATQGDLGDYLQLGPVGTAFLPSRLPRVLLIDEIDKSDLNLPNDLLNLFEEGEFEIPELVRRKRQRQKSDQADESDNRVWVRTADKDREVEIIDGRVQCCEFPIVIMTSNGEREFPPAFYRRCLRLRMPNPTAESLTPIVKAHFAKVDPKGWLDIEDKLEGVIEKFLAGENKADRATDQLLNAIYLNTREDSPDEEQLERLQKLIFKRLSEGS